MHGPYIGLPPGSYRARLQYASPCETSQEIGYLDVCCNPPAGQAVLAKAFLRGTRNELEIVELAFEVSSPEQGTLVETRVVSTGIGDVRLTDVAIISAQPERA
jgi:hypothetical protein